MDEVLVRGGKSGLTFFASVLSIEVFFELLTIVCRQDPIRFPLRLILLTLSKILHVLMTCNAVAPMGSNQLGAPFDIALLLLDITVCR